jgi:hypothetical protein
VKSSNPLYTVIRPIAISGRSALQFPMPGGVPECDIAIAVSGGTVVFGVQSWSVTDSAPPCDEAVAMATGLERYI